MPDEQDAARLGHEQPLVGVDRHGIGPLEAGEQHGGGAGGRGRKAVGAVHVQPDASLRADLCQLLERVDGARQRRPCRCDDGNRDDARRAVGVHGRGGVGRHQLPLRVDRERADTRGADAEELGGARDRVVRLARAVDGESLPGQPVAPAARERALPGCREGRHVRDRATARERPGTCREADERGDPVDRLPLDLGRCRGPGGEIRVEAGRERVADDRDLERRRADEREESRTRLGQRLVERERCVVEHVEGR